MELCEEKKLELQSLHHLYTFRWRAVLNLLMDNNVSSQLDWADDIIVSHVLYDCVK